MLTSEDSFTIRKKLGESNNKIYNVSIFEDIKN
jgi:hypothetical protein